MSHDPTVSSAAQPSLEENHIPLGPLATVYHERKLITLVEQGFWKIDESGQIWILATRVRGGIKILDVPRRAETKTTSGYLSCSASFGNKHISCGAHRVVWQHFHGDIPRGLVPNHKNSDKADNHPDNLELITQSENALHSFRSTGRRGLRGDAHYNHKIRESQVAEIKHRRAAGETLQSLADEFGVGPTTIMRHCGGPAKRRAKITPEDVMEIRELRGQGKSVRSIAEKFDLGISYVFDILAGRHWKHI